MHDLHRVVGGKAGQARYGILREEALDEGQMMLPAGQYGMDPGYMNGANGAEYGPPAYSQQGYNQQGYSQRQPNGATSRGECPPAHTESAEHVAEYISPPSNYGNGNGGSNMPKQWGGRILTGEADGNALSALDAVA